jgi:hypothetical protein
MDPEPAQPLGAREVKANTRTNTQGPLRRACQWSTTPDPKLDLISHASLAT